MLRGSFTEESLEILNFQRCERPNGTFYGTGGTCRKGAPVAPNESGGLKGRVPKNNPNNPLASGFTPMEKAQAKLKQYEKAISDPNKPATEEDLLRYGKLSNALDSFKNIEGFTRVKRRFGIGTTIDKSDLDESATRSKGKLLRKASTHEHSNLAKEIGAEKHPIKAILGTASDSKKTEQLLKKYKEGYKKSVSKEDLTPDERGFLFKRLIEIDSGISSLRRVIKKGADPNKLDSLSGVNKPSPQLDPRVRQSTLLKEQMKRYNKALNQRKEIRRVFSVPTWSSLAEAEVLQKNPDNRKNLVRNIRENQLWSLYPLGKL